MRSSRIETDDEAPPPPDDELADGSASGCGAGGVVSFRDSWTGGGVFAGSVAPAAAGDEALPAVGPEAGSPLEVAGEPPALGGGS